MQQYRKKELNDLDWRGLFFSHLIKKFIAPKDDDNRDILFFLLLSQTCRYARQTLASFFPTPLSVEQRLEYQIYHLIKLVVYGEKAQVEAIIKRSFLLLLKEGWATDYSGRVIVGSPFQAALRVGDVEMCKMMMRIARQHNMREILQDQPRPVYHNLREILQEQAKAIFPNGVEAYAIEQRSNVFNFDWIVTAINEASPEELTRELTTPGQDQPSSALNRALKAFRNSFIETSNGEIFNPFHLVTVLKREEQEFSKWNGNSRTEREDKQDLFLRQVVGYVQRCLPARYTETLVKGVYYVVATKAQQPEQRASTTIGTPSFVDSVGLGYTLAMGTRAPTSRGSQNDRAPLWEKYIERQLSALEKEVNPPNLRDLLFALTTKTSHR